jgi:thioester reductase-like protein
MEALSSRQLMLTDAECAKLRVLDGNTTEPQLGLSAEEYTWLVGNVTHIVHNAWPMSLRRPIHTFVPQFQALRNLLDLAREVACNRPSAGRNAYRIGFQLVSSISVIGSSTEQRVLEQRVRLPCTLPLGYPEAKWVCERMLDETLHRYPEHFRPMVVRPGQIAGSSHTGIWNPQEHMPFLIKSAQSLRAWPDLDGPMHWLPVDTVAQTMVDLLLPEINHTDSGCRDPDAYPVYHIDNPVGQPWKQMASILTEALDIPSDRVIPYQQWLALLRCSPLDRERDIPADKIMDFFTEYFQHMACGGVILDTTLCKQHSKCMAAQGPVSPDLVRRYIESWKAMGFLKS